jgi:transposase
VEQVIRIGMDTSKHFFQLHGVDGLERPVLRRQLTRVQMRKFFCGLPATVVALEACGASHYWARELKALGHEAKLIAPQLAKPYVKRGKHDAADAAALCEAASRPTMRYVPVKSAEQQAALMLAGERERLVGQRTQVANAIRGRAAEFGHVAAKGPAGFARLVEEIGGAADIPDLARGVFAGMIADHRGLRGRIAELDRQLLAWRKENEMARRLEAIPGVGPLIAALTVMKTPDPHAFRCGRDFAAWLGLTPKNHSTANKQRLGAITRAGDTTLRSLLVVGATAVIWQARRGRLRQPWPWLMDLIARTKPKLAAVALANKMARIAWKLMASGQTYRAPAAA